MACVWLRSTPVYYIEMEATITCGAYSHRVGQTVILLATGLHARISSLAPWPTTKENSKKAESLRSDLAQREDAQRANRLHVTISADFVVESAYACEEHSRPLQRLRQDRSTCMLSRGEQKIPNLLTIVAPLKVYLWMR
jgi:hypothetical protein